jgi:hypothetical protein
VSLRIAFDLDGVLADMDGELARQAQLLFGERVPRRLQVPGGEAQASTAVPLANHDSVKDTAADLEPPTNLDSGPPTVKLRMTARQERRLWRHVGTIENFWETLTETEPGAVARLAAVATERKWEVLFLTKRPSTAGSTAQVQTQRWLEAKGFALPSVYVVQGSRGRIAAALGLDFVIDDRPENCLDIVVDSKARAVLVWRESEKQLPIAARRLGIGVVKSVDECLDILTQVEAPASETAGVVDRVMQLLGL